MRLTKICLALGLGLLGGFQGATAQHKCGSDQYHQHLKQLDPTVAQAEAEINTLLKDKTIESRAAIYTIPVVFHVIHTNGPENISREQILDQIRVLNNDFNLLNGNRTKLRSVFNGLAADCQIKFELAKIDPNGNCTEGINRVYSSAGVQMDMTTEKVKSLINWNYKKYLNIWVVSSISGGIDGGEVLGYACFPWATNATRDGIVMKSDRVGTIGTAVASDSARTLTHEIGHWLGLYHTFQDGCTGGDQIDDTPPVNGTFVNASCPSGGNSCTNDFPDLPDMWENYMDYSNGGCQTLFTLKQKSRMHGVLTNGSYPRAAVVSAANLIATGVAPGSVAPVAAFTSSSTVICAGQSVKFYDLTCKSAPTAWSWTFTGSSQPSSSVQNPTITYQTPGTYSVSLTVQNAKGSNSTTKTSYITVLKSVAVNKANFEQSFEKGDPTTFTTDDKFTHSSPVGSRFVLENTTSYLGTNCYKAPITTGGNIGNTYSVTLPSVDISGMGALTPKFTFMAAYCQPSVDVTDVLRVYVSTDCGATYKQIMERSGTALGYTGQVYTNNFKPNKATQWKVMGLPSLSSIGLGLNSNLTFRIDFISAGGNPIYIDNINLGQYMAGINTLGEDLQIMEISPNPVEANAKIVIRNTKPNESVVVELLDLQGRTVASIFEGELSESTYTLFMSDLSLPSQGLYIVSLRSARGQIQKPVIFGK
ncbi:MAG: M43 family zinc metalloprotease [Bacteroidota bacterium]